MSDIAGQKAVQTISTKDISNFKLRKNMPIGIMVTLRKVALKEANHVYGVTMRDNGISEMIGNIDPNAVGTKGENKVDGGKTVAAA